MPKESQIKSLCHTQTMLNIGLKNTGNTILIAPSSQITPLIPKVHNFAPKFKTLEANSKSKAAKLPIPGFYTSQTPQDKPR